LRELSLSETEASPRRRSPPVGGSPPSKKVFFAFFYFARAGFFLPRLRRPALRRRLRQGEGFGGQVKGKENFFAGFYSERAGPLGLRFRSRREKIPSPKPPSFLPAC